MVNTGSMEGDWMHSQLIDDCQCIEDEEQRSTDVHIAPSQRATLRHSGTSPYRSAMAFLATLCVILLLSVIAVSTYYKNILQAVSNEHQNLLAQNESGGQFKMQKQPINMAVLIEDLRKMKEENEGLLKEKYELEARLAESGRVPTLPSTVPVTCPADWLRFNDSCYYISTRSRSWPDSQAWCKEKGGHLAIILTAEEQTFLWDQLPRGHWNAYWFGITDDRKEADWHWVDGNKLVGGFWEEGEPNNHIDEDCGYMVKTEVLERKAIRSWYDAPCFMYWPYICEKPMVH